MASSWYDAWEIEDLLGAVAEQDRAAFAELYRRTSSKLYAVIHRIIGDASRSEDAVQDLYVRVWRNAAGYDAGRGKPMTWLATMARNIAIDMRRREVARGQGRFAEIELDTLVDGAGAGTPETLAALRACLGRLDEEQRQLVVAAYLNGESREELAERTARPVGTIKSWLHRSLAALKSCLDG